MIFVVSEMLDLRAGGSIIHIQLDNATAVTYIDHQAGLATAQEE